MDDRIVQDKLLKAAEIAKILQISKSQAYRLMMTELPCVRFGSGTVRVRSVDLEKYIQSHINNHSDSKVEGLQIENEPVNA